MKERSTVKTLAITFLPLAVAGTTVAAGVAVPGQASAQVRAALVKEVDRPERQAVMIRRNTTTSIIENAFTVPAGKRLVVEEVNCSVLGTSAFYAGLMLNSLAHQNVVYSAPPLGETAGVRMFGGTTGVYFEPGETVLLRIFTTDNATCTVAGHTVDITP